MCARGQLYGFVGLVVLVSALSSPGVRLTEAWSAGPAFTAGPAANDGGVFTDRAVAGKSEGFGSEPANPGTVTGPSPLVSYLAGAVGAILLLRPKQKEPSGE